MWTNFPNIENRTYELISIKLNNLENSNKLLRPIAYASVKTQVLFYAHQSYLGDTTKLLQYHYPWPMVVGYVVYAKKASFSYA